MSSEDENEEETQDNLQDVGYENENELSDTLEIENSKNSDEDDSTKERPPPELKFWKNVEHFQISKIYRKG